MCSVWRVQVETALSERHCILKQGHDVIITFSRSVHVTLTQPGQNTWGLLSTMPGQEGDRCSLFPRLQFTHYRGCKPSIKTLIDKPVSQKWAWSGYMIMVSSIGDNKCCEVEEQPGFLCEEEQTDAVFEQWLSVLQQQKGNVKHLVSKATVRFVCPVNPIQRIEAELSLAQGG